MIARSTLVAAAGLGLAVGPAFRPVPAPAPPARDDAAFERDVRSFVAQYCTLCHQPALRQGELDLTRFEHAGAVVAEAALWRRALARVERGEMPPPGMPRPTAEETAALAGWLDAALPPPPPTPPVPAAAPFLRRLTRSNVDHVVQDLFGLELPVEEWLPADPVALGFDTVGAVQTVDPLLFERWVDLAETVAAEAVVVDEPGPPPTVRVESGDFEGGRRTGSGRLASNGEVRAAFRFPRDGQYLLRVGAWAEQAGGEPARAGVGVEGVRLERFDVEADRREAHQILEVRAEVEAGVREVGAAFLNDYHRPDTEDPADRDRNLIVEWIEVVGPIDRRARTNFQDALQDRVADERSERRRLRALLDHLALRLWRRPLLDTERRRLERLSGERDPLEVRLQRGLAGLLASPNFWFVIEEDPAPGDPPRALSGQELATRLALFLWASLPDDELLTLARTGELLDARVCASQVERMLDDPRQRLGADFAPQWLQVRQLENLSVDAERFPEYDADLRAAMLAETAGFFDAVLREDRDARELVTADWTVAGPRLAALYGLEVGLDEVAAGAAGLARVPLAETERRGVLGQAAVLTATSDPSRTSPVKRGKWVLDALLGAPPPPPPPGVPSLDEGEADVAGLSLRERLLAHRDDPNCAVCHAAMDPLGFGLERFDAIGRTRAAAEVDAAAELPDGRSFDGPVALAALLAEDERFLHNLVRRLAVYALGRELGPEDDPWLDALLDHARREGPTLRRLVRDVALSDAFRTRGRQRGRDQHR